VAEDLLLGQTTNGHGGDGQSATARAQQMVQYGQSDQIGVYPSDARQVQRQTEKILEEALAACRELLGDNKDDVEAVAKLLYERGTVPGDEIHALLDRAAA
jgi:ATP-dependent Zn protease